MLVRFVYLLGGRDFVFLSYSKFIFLLIFIWAIVSLYTKCRIFRLSFLTWKNIDQAIQSFWSLQSWFIKDHISFKAEIHGIFVMNRHCCICFLVNSFIIFSISLRKLCSMFKCFHEHESIWWDRQRQWKNEPRKWREFSTIKSFG